ncbi:hypothetical protein MSAN_01278500 [Mycena sanguinolenta]|uniref:Uncharacterized protein n=1 Tax=Mycena sanguinolenta TaxID=230812 RepID=A0A8H6YK16_9AGAR|nr:hypothetical protein MSAN_01278500 [Mycena sanguinolenta]
MSSSAIPHVVAFLTAPLVPKFSPAAVSSARLILSASLVNMPSSTFTLNVASAPPAPLLAASIGAGIPWAMWLEALGSGDDILLFYGPGFVKVRLGAAMVKNIWSEETQGSVVPISRAKAQMKVGPSPLLQQSTGGRLRAMLLSARVRNMRREQAPVAAPIRIPSLLAASACASDSDSDSDSDYCDDSDSSSSTSSKFTSYSNDSLTSLGSPSSTPLKTAPAALPVVGAYRPPFARARARREATRAPRACCNACWLPQEGHDGLPLQRWRHARHDRRCHARLAPRCALYALLNDPSLPHEHLGDGLVRPHELTPEFASPLDHLVALLPCDL